MRWVEEKFPSRRSSACRRWSWWCSGGFIASWAGIALSLGAITTAAAGSATLTWSAPTQNEDGSALTDLSGWKVVYGQSPSALTQSVQLTNPGLRSHVIEGLSAGRWYFAMRAVAGSGAATRESALTNLVDKVVEADPEPSGLRVAAPTVYTLIKQLDGLVFVPVGTVAVGTACDEAFPAGAYYVVPRAAVTWAGATQPVVVFAACADD